MLMCLMFRLWEDVSSIVYFLIMQNPLICVNGVQGECAWTIFEGISSERNRDMVVVRIWEGLGNQMFQYAYAYALRQRTGHTVCLDLRHCNRGDFPFEKKDIVKREVGIQHFSISMKHIDTRKIFGLRCLENTRKIYVPQYGLLKQRIGRWGIVEDADRITDCLQDIMEPRAFTYVNAHCMNRKYYSGYREGLLRELKLKREVRISNDLKKILRDDNTVSIHIRLTDYLRNPIAICRQEYYDRAIQCIKEKIENPCFLIFTDDLHMAKARYRFRENIYWVNEEGCTDYEELAIMSKCRHNIIAESTFSYWGAWLNANPEKTVIAPRKWFGGRLYEEGWKKL